MIKNRLLPLIFICGFISSGFAVVNVDCPTKAQFKDIATSYMFGDGESAGEVEFAGNNWSFSYDISHKDYPYGFFQVLVTQAFANVEAMTLDISKGPADKLICNYRYDFPSNAYVIFQLSPVGLLNVNDIESDDAGADSALAAEDSKNNDASLAIPVAAPSPEEIEDAATDAQNQLDQEQDANTVNDSGGGAGASDSDDDIDDQIETSETASSSAVPVDLADSPVE